MPGRSPSATIASTADQTGAAEFNGAARDAPILEMAVKFNTRAKWMVHRGQ